MILVKLFEACAWQQSKITIHLHRVLQKWYTVEDFLSNLFVSIEEKDIAII